MRRILPWLPAAAAATALAHGIATVAVPAVQHAAGSAGDLMPLRLGARALVAGRDPTDPRELEAQFRARPDAVRLGGFESYYPPTASVLALPLADSPFRATVRGVRWASLGALVVGGMLSALAGFGDAAGRDRRALVLACALGSAALWTHTRLARAVLGTAQPGPLVVLATAVAVVALGRRRDAAAGAAAGLGVALKLAPLALVPALVLDRRWRALGWLAAVPLVLAGAVAVRAEWDAPGWCARLLEFATRSPPPAATAGEPAILVALCAWRIPVVAAVSTLVLAAAARRERSAAGVVDLAMLGVAALGVVMAGSPHAHEALVGLPAVTHALAWPFQRVRARGAWIVAGGVLAAAGALGALDAELPIEGLRWLGIHSVAWLGCVARVLAGEGSPCAGDTLPPWRSRAWPRA